MYQTKTILRKASRKDNEPLNIVTWPTHENVDSLFSKIGHNVYAVQRKDWKAWNTRYRPVPDNFILLDKDLGENGLPHWVDFDLVLAQNVAAHGKEAYDIAATLNIPLVILQHCLPPHDLSDAEKAQVRNSFPGATNVFISEMSRQAWGFDETNAYVIRHTVDFDLFQPDPKIERGNYILSVANQFRERDYYLNFQGWARCIDGLPVRLVGDNPGLSQSAKDVDELAQEYQRASIFFNSSTISPIPSSLLDGAAAGCAIVSTSTCQIPSFFTHKEDAFLSNDEKELRYYLEELLNNPSLARDMGEKARERIMKECDPVRYKSNWNSILYKVSA
jgi:glycosyltransferase involved in cell wall biosynthesis